jgi:hypothetical protein
VEDAALPKSVLFSAASPNHNSLPSFIEYANRVNLGRTTPLYVGTHYEYTAADALLRLGFSLVRIGRNYDAGIDLIGHWMLPQLPAPIPVIVQCKARTETGKCGPTNIRELEGALQAVPPAWRNKDVLGLLVTTHKATSGTLEALASNRSPMGFLSISRHHGLIEQFVWNRTASERGLEGVGVTVRHTPRVHVPGSPVPLEQGQEGVMWRPPMRKSWVRREYRVAGTIKDIQLTWMGQPIFPDRQGPDDETVLLGSQIVEEALQKLEQRRIDAGELRKLKPKVKRGRPVGSKDKAPRKQTKKKALPVVVPRKRGRPKASVKVEMLTKEASEVLPRKRGRPKGSKNKKTKALEGKT